MTKLTDPETLILIGIIILASVVGRYLLIRIVKGVTNRALAKAKARRDGNSSNRAERVLAKVAMVRDARYQQRTATIASLISSLITVATAVIAGLTIMAVLGVPLAPLLTSAGVGGVALAFGAQSLVKDFLSGIFMIMEDQYGVGDEIDTGTQQGTVEDVGLRVTRLRDDTGTVWYLRNGDLVQIGNLSQGWSTAVVDIPLPAQTDPKQAIAVLSEVAKKVADDPDHQHQLLDVPTVEGLNAVTTSTITVRMTARTTPKQSERLQAVLLQAALAALKQAGLITEDS